MRWVITEGKLRWAHGFTPDDCPEPIFKMQDVINFILECNKPEDFYIWFENGKKFKLIDYKMGDENNE